MQNTHSWHGSAAFYSIDSASTGGEAEGRAAEESGAWRTEVPLAQEAKQKVQVHLAPSLLSSNEKRAAYAYEVLSPNYVNYDYGIRDLLVHFVR